MHQGVAHLKDANFRENKLWKEQIFVPPKNCSRETPPHEKSVLNEILILILVTLFEGRGVILFLFSRLNFWHNVYFLYEHEKTSTVSFTCSYESPE